MNNRGIDICRIIRERERDIQEQTIEGKIREANYNKRYRELVKDRPHYLLQESLDRVEKGDMVRALVKARCGNLEEANKYWCQEELRTCIFCRKGLDSLDHFMEDCKVAKQWFEGIGNNKEEKIQRIMDDKLDENKGKILDKLWKEKERKKKEKKQESVTGINSGSVVIERGSCN